MSKYEIDIEGLPDGWEPAELVIMVNPEQMPTFGAAHIASSLLVHRKMRKYDWSKTLDDTLTMRIGWDEVGMRPLHKLDAHYKVKLAEVWQPNIHGKCPVDPEASIVRLKYEDGRVDGEALAGCVGWSHGRGVATVIAYQFIRLADGVEW